MSANQIDAPAQKWETANKVVLPGTSYLNIALNKEQLDYIVKQVAEALKEQK